MKTKLATSLSVAAVLAAGSVAAIVNTEILDDGAGEAAASAAVLPPASSVDVAVPSVTLSTLPTTVVEASTASAPTTTGLGTQPPVPVVPSSSLTAFNVGDAGVVTVDVIDGRLVLVSADPKPGWTIAKSEERAEANDAEVEFVSATMRVEFEVALVDGQIVPTVESSAISATLTGAPTAATNSAQATTSPRAGDDDHDDYDDDDHDDEHDDDLADAEDEHEDEDHEAVEVEDDDGGERDDD
jgi:hypothetical protein